MKGKSKQGDPELPKEIRLQQHEVHPKSLKFKPYNSPMLA